MRPIALFLFGATLAAAPALLVLQKGASSLAFYSEEGKLLQAIPVGPHPHEMVFSKDRRFLYITDNGTMRIEQAGAGGNSLSIVDVRARVKVGSISLGQFRRPHGIDLDPATGRLAVTTELPDQLLLVDPWAGKVLRTYDTRGKTSHMVSFGPGGQFAYVSNSSSGNVAAINMATGAVTLIAVGERPEGSVLSTDGSKLYVALREAAKIAVIDTAANRVIGAIPTGKGPVRIALTPDGGTLVYAVMHDHAVEFADTSTQRVAGRVAIAGSPVSLHLSPDAKRAFASSEEINTVHMISVSDRKLIRSFTTAKDSGPDPVMELR